MTDLVTRLRAWQGPWLCPKCGHHYFSAHGFDRGGGPVCETPAAVAICLLCGKPAVGRCEATSSIYHRTLRTGE
jgi:predicted RNA-binding Zn-ribbon protein involved in translation (DUF1610 family)